jgi:hypothetical protein
MLFSAASEPQYFSHGSAMPRSIRPTGTTAMESDEEEDEVGELTELLTPEEVLKGQTITLRLTSELSGSFIPHKKA